jgi:hypothetical protein
LPTLGYVPGELALALHSLTILVHCEV